MLDDWQPGKTEKLPLKERTDLDRWISLRLDSGRRQTTRKTRLRHRLAFQLRHRARRAQNCKLFVDDLTDGTIRRSRSRFWSATETNARDKEAAYQTLYEVLTTLARLLAPFTPFMADSMHEILVRSQRSDSPASVHLEEWPRQLTLGPTPSFARRSGSSSRSRSGSGSSVWRRAARATHDLKTRQPLRSITLAFAPGLLGVGRPGAPRNEHAT